MVNAIVRATDITNSLEDIQRIGKMLAVTGYFAAKGDGNVAIAQMATQILAGREMGYGPFASVQGIHIINGKPALSANLMAAAVKNSPRYDYRVKEISDQVCRIEFFEYVDGKRESLGVSEFTLAQAQKAGVKNLDKFARNMLFARAISNGVRWYCPDVFSGNAVYVPEELGAEVDGDGDIVDVTGIRIDNVREISQDGPTDAVTSEHTTQAQETPQNGAVAATGQSSETAKVSDKTQSQLHALGTELYGDQWTDVRHHNIGRLTNERTHSSKDLTQDEAQMLINGMLKVKREKAQARAREATQQQPDAKLREAA